MTASANYFVWILIAVVAVAVAAALLWSLGRRAKTLIAPVAGQATLTDRLQQANEQLAAVISAENQALLSVTTLPDDVGPLEAEAALRAATPDWSMHDRQVLMLQAWEVQRRPQALAALAGLPLANPEKSFGLLTGTILRALRDGGPSLLAQIDEAINAHFIALDTMMNGGGVAVGLERAAERVRAEAPDVAAALETTVRRIWPRLRGRLLAVLRIKIEEWEDREPLEPREMAGALAQYSWPRMPELMAEVHMALDRHDGPEWDRAHLWYDKAVLHRYHDVEGALAGFNKDAAVERLASGIMSADAETSRFAAETAADLLGDYFFDDPRQFAALQGALDWARGVHEVTPDHKWLAEQLDPTEVSEAKLNEAAADLALHQTVRESVAAFGATTATTDPEIALAELRQLLPDAPREMIRVALVERWKDSRSPVHLTALAGLALEALDETRGGSSAALCLHWPLRNGSPEQVLAIIDALDKRSEHLEGSEHLEDWMRTQDGVRELRRAFARISDSAGVGTSVKEFMEWVEARHVLLLGEAIEARLAMEADKSDDERAFQLALDLYRLALPNEPALLWPVQKFMRDREASAAWREALLHFEAMRANYFAAHGEADPYELDDLVTLWCEALRDESADVARLAAAQAAKLVGNGVVEKPVDLARLDERLTWAGNLHPLLPDSFLTLRTALAKAMGKS
ncbi:hypothetical protein [Devosia sediminis]|uniref:Uncharacterized protein n=1 Tax=Devosia sediminis TaxID=2798801 RepID=A0A934IMM7_9HYPH|nr:hypothetical protein [Devosia sediminis]MBJ3783549.1 hypothetical protein [Devosia sediminis]